MTTIPPSPFLSAYAKADVVNGQLTGITICDPRPVPDYPASVELQSCFSTAVEAAAPPPAPVSGAAADPIPAIKGSEGGSEEAPAALSPNTAPAGATDHIHEIFHFARKMITEPVSRQDEIDYHGLHAVADEIEAWQAENDIPLFLRRA
jgi:hypothetical protein